MAKRRRTFEFNRESGWREGVPGEGKIRVGVGRWRTEQAEFGKAEEGAEGSLERIKDKGCCRMRIMVRVVVVGWERGD